MRGGLQLVSNQGQEENSEVKDREQPQEYKRAQAKAAAPLKMTKELGGHCEYSMALVVLSQ